jgi:hypothetical protein
MSYIFGVIFVLFLVSCSSQDDNDVAKTPCVSAHGGPCDGRHNPNDEFLKSIGYKA